MSQQECFTLLGREIGECCIDTPNKSLIRQRDVRITDGLWQDGCVVDERMMSLAFSGEGPTAIAEDAKEPWIEGLVAAKTGEVVKYAHEGVLHRFLCIAWIAEHGAGKAQRARVVQFHQLREARSIALARPTQDVWCERVYRGFSWGGQCVLQSDDLALHAAERFEGAICAAGKRAPKHRGLCGLVGIADDLRVRY